MNISVNRAELLKAVVNVSKAINSASVSAVPVLGKILFSVEGDTLSVKASNQNSAISVKVKLDSTDGDCAFLFEAGAIKKILSDAPSEQVTIYSTSDTSQLSLDYGVGTFMLGTDDASIYPDVLLDASGSSYKEIHVESPSEFLIGMARALACSGQDKNRPQLMSVLLDIHTDTMSIVGTSGIVLSQYDVKLSQPSEEQSEVVLPANIASIFLSGIISEDSDMHLFYNDKTIRLETDNETFTAIVLDFKYPKYARVVEQLSKTNSFKVDLLPFVSSIKRVASPNSKVDRLIDLSVSQSRVVASCNDIFSSYSARENINATEITGDTPLECVSLNFDLLASLLKNLTSPQVTFNINGSSAATSVVEEQEEGSTLKRVNIIMPMAKKKS